MADTNPHTPGTDGIDKILRPKPKDRHAEGQWGNTTEGPEESTPRRHYPDSGEGTNDPDKLNASRNGRAAGDPEQAERDNADALAASTGASGQT
jgi:hypothetical protein